MPFTGRYPLIICLSIALLVGQLGCALGPQLLRPPPSERVRAQLGTIGILSARFAPEAKLEGPTRGKGSGAAKGAAGFLGSIAAGLEAGAYAGEAGILAFALGLALAPPAAVVGGLVGAAKAEPAASVKQAETTLKNALIGLNIRQEMRDRVLQVARQRTGYAFLLLPEEGQTNDEEVSYRSVAGQGVDTVLEIGVSAFALSGKWGVNPPLALIMTVRTRLIRVVDPTPVYETALEYRSRTRKFTEWAVNNAQPLREELDRAYQSLAGKIVDELFLLYLPLESGADRQ